MVSFAGWRTNRIHTYHPANVIAALIDTKYRRNQQPQGNPVKSASSASEPVR
jgi:hypothetical protein